MAITHFVVLFLLAITNTCTSQPQCICVQKIADGFIRPTVIRSKPDRSGRLYVGDITGTIWIVDGTQALPRPLLDLGYRELDSFTLQSMQFHPDYEQNGRLFLQYHYLESFASNATRHQVVSEFRRDDLDQDLIDPESEKILLHINETRTMHTEGDVSSYEDKEDMF